MNFFSREKSGSANNAKNRLTVMLTSERGLLLGCNVDELTKEIKAVVQKYTKSQRVSVNAIMDRQNNLDITVVANQCNK